jgi:hypothetical protein
MPPVQKTKDPEPVTRDFTASTPIRVSLKDDNDLEQAQGLPLLCFPTD